MAILRVRKGVILLEIVGEMPIVRINIHVGLLGKRGNDYSEGS